MDTFIGVFIALELGVIGYLFWKWTNKPEPVQYSKDYELLDFEFAMTSIQNFKKGQSPMLEKPQGTGWRLHDVRLWRAQNGSLELVGVWRKEKAYDLD